RPLPAAKASGAKSKKATPITAPAEKPNTSGSLPSSFNASTPPDMVAAKAPRAISRIRMAVMARALAKARPSGNRRHGRTANGDLAWTIIEGCGHAEISGDFEHVGGAMRAVRGRYPRQAAGHLGGRPGLALSARCRCDGAEAAQHPQASKPVTGGRWRGGRVAHCHLAVPHQHADRGTSISPRHPGQCWRTAGHQAKLLVGDQDQGPHPYTMHQGSRTHDGGGKLAGDSRCRS